MKRINFVVTMFKEFDNEYVITVPDEFIETRVDIFDLIQHAKLVNTSEAKSQARVETYTFIKVEKED